MSMQEQNEFDRCGDVMDCLSRPAFLIRDGRIIRQNNLADMERSAQEAMQQALSGEALQADQVIRTEKWTLHVRPCGMDLLVQAYDPRRRSPFVAETARDLRDPLADLYAALTSLNALEQLDDPVCRPLTAQINRSFYRLLRAVINAETVAAGEVQILPKPLDLTMQLGKWCEEIASAVKTANCTLRAELPQKSVCVMADAAQLERAVLNLCTNAIASAPAGSEITLQLREIHTYAAIEISAPTKEDICLFEDLTGESYNSMGMEIVRMIARAHGGALLVDSDAHRFRAMLTLSMRGAPACEGMLSAVRLDYSSGFDHLLMEFSPILPAMMYDPRAF